MSDPLMLAMSQSGIIENSNIPNNQQILPETKIKIATPVLPKKIILVPRTALPQRIQLKPLSLPSMRLKRPGSHLEGTPKKLKPTNPAEFGMRGPVISKIFGRTYDNSPFKLQV